MDSSIAQMVAVFPTYKYDVVLPIHVTQLGCVGEYGIELARPYAYESLLLYGINPEEILRSTNAGGIGNRPCARLKPSARFDTLFTCCRAKQP